MITIKICLEYFSLALHQKTFLSFFRTVQSCFGPLPPQMALLTFLTVTPLFILPYYWWYCYSCLCYRDEPKIVIQWVLTEWMHTLCTHYPWPHLNPAAAYCKVRFLKLSIAREITALQQPEAHKKAFTLDARTNSICSLGFVRLGRDLSVQP